MSTEDPLATGTGGKTAGTGGSSGGETGGAPGSGGRGTGGAPGTGGGNGGGTGGAPGTGGVATGTGGGPGTGGGNGGGTGGAPGTGGVATGTGGGGGAGDCSSLPLCDTFESTPTGSAPSSALWTLIPTSASGSATIDSMGAHGSSRSLKVVSPIGCTCATARSSARWAR